MEVPGVRDTSLTLFSSYIHDWMETRDSYLAMSGDKLPMVFNSSRINLRASPVYPIYVCDLPAVVQHCSICIYAEDTSIYVSSTTSTACALLEKDTYKVLL